jgi:ribosomal protein S18 acetylase RimI-like enzyme
MPPHTPSSAFRRAGPADLAIVQRISAEAYSAAYLPVIGAVPTPATEDYAPHIARGEVWLLEVAGGTVGLAVLEEKPDHLVIYSIAVNPDAQRQGHGTTLLDFAAERAAAAGLSELRLYTNPRMTGNVALYRRCGFVEKGTRPHPSQAGERLVDMVRSLAPSDRGEVPK